jgi:hypothetical protein
MEFWRVIFLNTLLAVSSQQQPQQQALQPPPPSPPQKIELNTENFVRLQPPGGTAL